MTTTHDTQATEEGPNQSTITEAVPLPTNSGRMGLRDLLDRFFAAIRSNTNADLDGPEDRDENATLPLGVKLTGYRLLNIAVMFTIGVAKFILSLKGQSIAPTGLEYAGGSVLAIWLYWIGFYEAVEPRRWGWFFPRRLGACDRFCLEVSSRSCPLVACSHLEIPPVICSDTSMYHSPWTSSWHIRWGYLEWEPFWVS